MKFEISLERSVRIEETALVTIEAASAKEARALMKARIAAGDTEFDWEACDTNFGSIRIDDVAARP